VLKDELDQSDGNGSVAIEYVGDVGGALVVDLLVHELELLLDLVPVPVEVARRLLIPYLEEAGILQAHKGDHVLVAIVHDEGAHELLIVLGLKATLSRR